MDYETKTLKPITAPQIKKIWALARELQISEDNLHIRIFALTKKEHIGWKKGTGLSFDEAGTVIRDLSKMKPKKRKQKTIRSESGVIALATPDQKSFLEDLILKINSTGKYKLSLDGMSQRQLKKSAHLLTRNDARILTESLKSILARVKNSSPSL